MSSRRKAKVARKEAASKPATGARRWREPKFKIDHAEDIDTKETGELVTRIVNSNHMKYRCPKCGGQEHRTDIDEFEATVFTCSSCGDKLNVVSPLFFGEGHDCIMGYAVIEVTDNPKQPFQMHYFGYDPGFMA